MFNLQKKNTILTNTRRIKQNLTNVPVAVDQRLLMQCKLALKAKQKTVYAQNIQPGGP